MRDSNSRGVAPNTLSKSAGPRSVMAAMVRDLRTDDTAAMIWTLLNGGE
jgi:hypothetical protein